MGTIKRINFQFNFVYILKLIQKLNFPESKFWYRMIQKRTFVTFKIIKFHFNAVIFSRDSLYIICYSEKTINV